MRLPLFRRPVEQHELTLTDGRVVRAQPLTPAAKPLIVQAMRQLSPETSRRRFFTVRKQLSDDELDRLTQPDGWRAFALGATIRAEDGVGEGVGVARFTRIAAEPRAGEAAIVVVDAYQGMGIGRWLLRRLAAAALDRGIDRLRGIVLPDNAPMIGLLRAHAPGLALIRSGDHLDIEVRLDRRALRAS